MIIEHLILARESSVDRDRNTLSVFDFVEDLQVEAPPGHKMLVPVQVIAVIKREEKDVGEIRSNFVLSCLNPKGAVASKNDIPVTLASQHVRQRVRVGTAIEITEGGNYTFRFVKGDAPSVSREVSIRISITPRIGTA